MSGSLLPRLIDGACEALGDLTLAVEHEADPGEEGPEREHASREELKPDRPYVVLRL
jgi:hypothetical protein